VKKLTGYQKWKLAGESLKANEKPLGYTGHSDGRLQQLKKTAEKWLIEHEQSPLYQKALWKYEAICDAIKIKEAEKILGSKAY